jgi:hypothetical protein
MQKGWPLAGPFLFGFLQIGYDRPVSAGGTAMTLERAILLTVCGLIILSVLLAVYVNLNWLWLTGLFCAHLVQASLAYPVVMMFKRMGLPSKAGFT